MGVNGHRHVKALFDSATRSLKGAEPLKCGTHWNQKYRSAEPITGRGGERTGTETAPEWGEGATGGRGGGGGREMGGRGKRCMGGHTPPPPPRTSWPSPLWPLTATDFLLLLSGAEAWEYCDCVKLSQSHKLTFIVHYKPICCASWGESDRTVCAFVRACVRACVCVCMEGYLYVCVHIHVHYRQRAWLQRQNCGISYNTDETVEPNWSKQTVDQLFFSLIPPRTSFFIFLTEGGKGWVGGRVHFEKQHTHKTAAPSARSGLSKLWTKEHCSRSRHTLWALIWERENSNP